MNHEFQRVAIVNRGEAAMRFIHAVREFNQEHGTALRTIALFTEPDRHAMFVREADEAVCLGPAQVLDSNTQQLKSSYVDYDRIEQGLVAGAGGRGLGRMGLRRRARCFRRPLPRHGHRLHRPGWRRDAEAGRQDFVEAPGRASADSRSALERRPGGNARRRRAPR